MQMLQPSSTQAESTQDMYVYQYCAAFPCVLVTCICILHVLRAAVPVLALRSQDTCVCIK